MLNTKKDFQECLKKILLPLKNKYTEGGAFLKCGNVGVEYGERTSLIEAFIRPMWGLAPLWAGNGDIDGFGDIYIKGIINGTDPEHSEYWGKMKDFDQKIVETAAIGLGLILAPDKIWTPLNGAQKENLYYWISQVNKVKSVSNNWQFFAVLVNLGLKNVGAPYNEAVVKVCIEKIHSYYNKNGWYLDGNTTQADYYIAFALHFYGLIYAKVMEKEDPDNSNIFKERAMKFAKDFIYWFSDDGSAVAFGRSLTYRFAQCCFWSACIFADVYPFSIGVIKGIIVRNLEWWLKQPIFDNDGVLTIGYAYPNLVMADKYNGQGSAYWALKAFLILALDDNHKFFKTEALPLPKLEKIHIIEEANMVIQRVGDGVTMLTAGQWAGWNPIHAPEKYSKFAYSSKYGFSVPRSYYKIENAGCDSMLAFVKEDMCFVRKQCIETAIDKCGNIYSKWSPYEGVMVETKVIPTERGQIREHMVTCNAPCEAYDCSFATVDGSCKVRSEQGDSITLKCMPNENLINPDTYINAVKYLFEVGRTRVETSITYPNL